MSYFTRATVRTKAEIESEIQRNLLDARNESSARTCHGRETQNHEDKNILQNETHFVF